MFEVDNCKVISRLLEGEYLKYNSIVPKDFETTLNVNVKEILASLERASLICASESKKIPVTFDIGVDEIIITSQAETGSAKENVKAETTGNNLKICFNPKYLLDALKASEDTTVNMRFSSSIGPCTINPLEGDGFIYLVLPVKAS
jgi:DNA polymerase-3 subunit beta